MAIGDPYTTLSELRAYLNITDAADTADDVHITRACASVRRWIELHCGRQFNVAGSATARTYKATHSDRLDVHDISTLTGLVVKTDPGDDGTFDTTWTINTDFIMEPLNGIKNGMIGWPYERIVGLGTKSFSSGRRPLIEVTANWGWAAVPEDVEQASIILAAQVFKRRQSPEGVLGGYGDFGPVRVGNRLDPDVLRNLEPYRTGVCFA